MMSKNSKSIRETITGPAYGIFSFLLFIFSAVWLVKPLNEYLIGDSSMFILLIQKFFGYIQTPVVDFSSGASIWHPLLYPAVMTAFTKLFGPDLIWQRSVGLLCLAISLFLIIKIVNSVSRNVSEKRVIILLSCGIFILIPYGLIGSVHIDIDNTIITPILLLFIYFFSRFQNAENKSKIKFYIALCLSLSLGLWAKLTTPLLLPPSIFLFYVIKRKPVKAFIYSAGLLLIGGGVFFFTWYFFCRALNLPYAGVFKRIFGVFFDKSADASQAGILSFARDIALLGFWFNPLLIVVWIKKSIDIIKDCLQKKSVNDIVLFVAILTMALFFGYILIGRIIFTVPKYHFPATILIAFSLALSIHAWFLDMKIKKYFMLASCMIILAICYYCIGDPIYLLTYQLKINALNNLSFQPVLLKMGGIFILYLLPLLVYLGFVLAKQPEKAKVALLIGIMAQTCGFKFRQSFSEYRIGYAYGYKGEAEVLRRLPDKGIFLYPEGSIVAPEGKLKGTEILNFGGRSIEGWKNIVTQKKPEAIIIGQALCPLSTIKYLYENPEWKELMSKYYTMTDYADFRVFIKRPVKS